MTAPTAPQAPLRRIEDAVWLDEERYPGTVLATLSCGHTLIREMSWVARPANLVDLRERCQLCVVVAARLNEEAAEVMA